MIAWSKFKENQLRPFFFLGRNYLSLIGGTLTTASAFILVGFWIIGVLGHGGSKNPYLGIIVDLIFPVIFLLGLLLIPIGIWIRRRHLKSIGQLPTTFPKIDFGDPVFRNSVAFVIILTFINFVILGTASYRGVAYMDTPSFCGQSCHVMEPEWTAYHVSPHSDVACTKCHIGPGVQNFVQAKMNGTKQMFEVFFNDYDRPIMPDDKIPSARLTCLGCHDSSRNMGDKLLVQTTFGDDEKNSVTHTVILLHVGGRDQYQHLTGIHGAHLARIEYIATNDNRQIIPWVRKRNADGSVTEFVASGHKNEPAGQKRTMDCIDCHNRAAHSFETPGDALNKSMADGNLSTSLPFVHKEGLGLLQVKYISRTDAALKIQSGLEQFYRSEYPNIWNRQQTQIVQAAKILVTIYGENVFPFMKVKWGTHPNNLGHNVYPGCFRCHDGNHIAKNGQVIGQDCNFCHALIAVDDKSPKILAQLGYQ